MVETREVAAMMGHSREGLTRDGSAARYLGTSLVIHGKTQASLCSLVIHGGAPAKQQVG